MGRLFGFELLIAVQHTSLQRFPRFIRCRGWKHHLQSDSRPSASPQMLTISVCMEFIRFSSERTIRLVLKSQQLLVFTVQLSQFDSSGQGVAECWVIKAPPARSADDISRAVPVGLPPSSVWVPLPPRCSRSCMQHPCVPTAACQTRKHDEIFPQHLQPF